MRKDSQTERTARPKPLSPTERGFTLLELMVVVAILLVLLAIGAGRYQMATVRAREAALTQDLAEMNKAIQNYTLDKEAAPTSLDDLVSAQYLGRIPNDPVSDTNDWVTENCDALLSADQSLTGICSVHSGSNAVSPFTNTPYSSW
ncbi:MAG TPA: prepilin-type N-terminal cleavage/methylation domain-containing protein [Candidatus Acidoferrum sp.]|nr:prepilin-type N-terminal cleavage/methylation domain-containing protein [Candidatus Acidoferrum sp.]